MGSQGRQSRPSMQSQSFKTKAKNRLDDLQSLFCNLQQARRDNRGGDATILEEQVNQMLKEWKAELHEPSPATSLAVGSPSSSELSSDMQRLLQLTEENDDATSSLAACLAKPMYEQRGRSSQAFCANEVSAAHAMNPSLTVGYNTHYVGAEERRFEEEMLDRLLRTEKQAECSPVRQDDNLSLQEQLASSPLFMQDSLSHKYYPDGTGCPPDEPFSSVMSPPPAAFLGPKCALWDCPRPATRSEWLLDYCSTFHATLALNEGADGRSPVVRPGGIDLKDGPLFSSLFAKSQSKAVGIPECEGAATSKSPWNAYELFDTSMLQSEVIREWLFFDKPRRAFESGTRKQRSLPDHNGRGWHESRKQVMKDLGGLKRSYYMDPQPNPQLEWHLYEYELSDYDACALYRLELKQVNTNKKGGRSKAQSDPVTALQNQIGRLPANLSAQDGKVWTPEMNIITETKNQKPRTKGNQNAARTIEQSADNEALIGSFDYVEDMSSYLLSP